MGNRFFRPSQFVTTFGVGSITRIGKQSRVIPSFQKMELDMKGFDKFRKKDDLTKKTGIDKFQIHDTKMEQILRGKLEAENVLDSKDKSQLKIFRLVTNSDLEISDGTKLYETYPFPKWSVCKRHGNLEILTKLEKQKYDLVLPCPLCEKEGKTFELGVGVRFIRACHHGHMDDLDWHWEVHQGSDCDSDAYYWSEEDSNFEVKCIKCYKSTDYVQIKTRSDRDAIVCNAHWAEYDSEDSSGCSDFQNGQTIQTAKLILKNAANLRLPQILTSLLIPPYSDEIYRTLKDYDQALLYLPNGENSSQEEVIEHFMNKKEDLNLGDEFFSVLKKTDELTIKRTVKIILVEMRQKISVSPQDAEEDEFNQLLNVSANGYPTPYNGEQELFVVHKHKVKTFKAQKFDLDFVITPIDILHVTQVQIGYTREVKVRPEKELDRFLITPTGDLVPTYLEKKELGKSAKWFVGSQLRGEGIFIHVKDHDIFKLKDTEAFQAWNKLSDA